MFRQQKRIWSPIVATALAAASLLAAGCGGSPTPADAATGSTARGLEESEVAAIAKTAKTEKAIMDAVKKKMMENQGVVIPAKTSGRATTGRR